MLHVEHIHKTFFAGTINEKVALQDLSLHLAPGDFVTVIGGNGAGKSRRGQIHTVKLHCRCFSD